MKHIFVMNGQGEAGKDTFVMYCMQYLNSEHKMTTKNLSSVDEAKQYGRLLGWDGKKDAKGRKFLSDLKALSTRYDGPINYLSRHMSDSECDVAFVHIREPDEIQKFIEAYPDAITVLVRRGTWLQMGNPSDDEIEDFVYDCYINNNGTEKKLKETAEETMKYYVVSLT